MSFFPQKQIRTVPSLGRPTAKIAIVGDYTSAFDDKALVPFSGPAGSVLEQCLHAAQLIKAEVYITNCIKVKSNAKYHPLKGPATDYFTEGKGGGFTQKGLEQVDTLRDELNSLDANVIVTCGDAAFAAVCQLGSLSKYRGYVFGSRGLAKIRKVIPTHHPADAMRGMYTYRHMIVADLKKAKRESLSPDIERPQRQLVYDYASVEEVLGWLDYFAQQERVSVDIEVINYCVASVQFSSDPSIGCVVPIGNTIYRPQGWTEDEELVIWRAIQKVTGNPKIKKVLQNAIFDIQFLLAEMGVTFAGDIEDTMIAHSVIYPELPKGLGFLGSIYCGSQAYWKDTVKFKNIKEES
jgi:uracil-DNA glycosylase